MTRAVKDICTDLGNLLASEGYRFKEIDAAAANPTGGCDALASLEIWGGMGSLGDVYFCRENLAARKDAEQYAELLGRPDSAFAASNRRFSELMAELSECFVATCNEPRHQKWHARAEDIGSIHREWVESGVR